MAEVVGVVAAATQLAGVCLNLLDLTRKIKGAPSTLRDYQVQLQELRSLSDAISQNPLLQTPEVGAHTDFLLAVVKDNNLKPLIARHRFLRTWAFIYKDQELSNIFGTLERRKSSLSLVIHNLQAQALHQIQSDIHVMASSQFSNDDSSYDGSQYGGNQPPPNTHSNAQPSTRPIQAVQPVNPPVLAPPPINITWNTAPPSADDNGPFGGSFRFDGTPSGHFQQPPTVWVPPSESLAKFREGLVKRREILEEMPGANVVHNCYSYGGGKQYNGLMIRGAGVSKTVNNLLAGAPSAVLDCYTVGSGIQHNGVYVETDEEIEINLPTDGNHLVSGSATIAMTLPDGETVEGEQRNGVYFYHRADKEKGDSEDHAGN